MADEAKEYGQLKPHIAGHTLVDNNDGTITISGPCVFTKKEYSATVPKAGYMAFRYGEMVQIAMPTVSDNDREFILSGISPTGWDSVISKIHDKK